jgi:tetraacyldisaccharide 4'-kinase
VAGGTARWLWTRSPSAAVAGTLLTPASWVYGAVVGVRSWLYDEGVLAIARVEVPILSVGNLTVGGSGKTPFAGWLIGRLLELRRRPALLHGGYAQDEPELHRRWHPHVPVYAERDRTASAQRAVADGADAIVLDDGFQHRRLARDADIVLIAAEQWSGRRPLLPAGPWREPVSALRRANIVVITRRTASAERAARVAFEVQPFAGVTAPVAVASILPSGWRPCRGETTDDNAAAMENVLAVAGIARPDLFAVNAQAMGARIVDTMWFPDHHAYDAHDAHRIAERAAGRAIVTTAKDAVKLERLMPTATLRVLEQVVHIERGEDALGIVIERALA